LETTDGDDSASWRIIAVSVLSLPGMLQTAILPRGWVEYSRGEFGLEIFMMKNLAESTNPEVTVII